MRRSGAGISNLGHKRDWFLSVQRQERLGSGALGGSDSTLELDEHGLEPVPAPSPDCSAIDVRLERKNLAGDRLREQRGQCAETARRARREPRFRVAQQGVARGSWVADGARVAQVAQNLA